MKADALNWEHTPVVHHSGYNDSVFWTPSEIALFQEAIYKSEKDFTEVARKVNDVMTFKCFSPILLFFWSSGFRDKRIFSYLTKKHKFFKFVFESFDFVYLLHFRSFTVCTKVYREPVWCKVFKNFW